MVTVSRLRRLASDGRCGLLLLKEEEDVREDEVEEEEEGMDGAWKARAGEGAIVVKAAARKRAAVERVRAVVLDEEEEEEEGEEEEGEVKPTMTAQAAVWREGNSNSSAGPFPVKLCVYVWRRGGWCEGVGRR